MSLLRNNNQFILNFKVVTFFSQLITSNVRLNLFIYIIYNIFELHVLFSKQSCNNNLVIESLSAKKSLVEGLFAIYMLREINLDRK